MRDDFFADDSCSGRFLFGTIFCLGRIFVRADSVVWDDLFGTTCQGEFLLRNDLNGRMIHRSECRDNLFVVMGLAGNDCSG